MGIKLSFGLEGGEGTSLLVSLLPVEWEKSPGGARHTRQLSQGGNFS